MFQLILTTFIHSFICPLTLSKWFELLRESGGKHSKCCMPNAAFLIYHRWVSPLQVHYFMVDSFSILDFPIAEISSMASNSNKSAFSARSGRNWFNRKYASQSTLISQHDHTLFYTLLVTCVFWANPLTNTRENIPHQEHRFNFFSLLSIMHVLHLSTRHTSPST